MRNARTCLLGIVLVGCGAIAAFVGGAWMGPIAVGLAVIGFILAVWVLSARDDQLPKAAETSRRSNRFPTALIVTTGAAGGLLAAETGTDAWFPAGLCFALLIWFFRPGAMD